MKRSLILILIINFLFTDTLSGRCAGSGYSVWPRGKTLNINSILIITGFGSSQQVIHNLHIYEVYLESYSDSVGLKIVRIYTGEDGVTQAVLKPSRKLTVGKTYSLRIANLSGDEKYEFNNEKFAWEILDRIDTDNPKWLKLPCYLGKEWIKYGCGPEENAKFGICVSDNSPVVVLARLKEVKTGITIEYFVEPDSTVLNIGHDMCYGAFRFVDDWDYEVSFSLMDASGNKVDTLTSLFHFKGPNEADSILLVNNCFCTALDNKSPLRSNNSLLYILSAVGILTTIVLLLRKKGSR